MKNLITFEECCEYLGISTELPRCQIRERQLQAAYKLSVCMMAWNKQDEFNPDETAFNNQKNEGYAPFFYLEHNGFLSLGYATASSYVGLVSIYKNYTNIVSHACMGLRFSFITRERAYEFGKALIDIFNELI